MKHLKKIALIFAVVVCFAMCFFTAEGSAESYSNLGYTVNNGEVIITYCNYYSASGEIEIPEEIDGYPVTGIGVLAFDNCSKITNIIIPDSVKSIGNGAFAFCSGLTNLTIPDSVTNIGGGVFYFCSSLENVKLSNNIKSLDNYCNKYEEEFGFFEGCSKLSNIIIPDSITSIGKSAFKDCKSLTSVDISENIKTIDKYTFSGCSNLVNVTIPDDVMNIKEYAFENCSSLKSIDIPNSVTNIGGSTFSGCSSLEEITLPFVGGSSKSSDDYYQYPFGYVFGGHSYTGGKSIKQYCIGIGNSLTYCIPAKLKTVTITDKNIPYCAFYNCSNITNINIPDDVISIGDNAFYNTVYYNDSSNWENNVLYIGHNLIEAKDTLAGTYTIKPGTKCIADSAFYGLSKLRMVNIPNGVAGIGKNLFYNCTGLTRVNIPDGVFSIGECAFYNCSSLTSITIPDSVTSIGWGAFYKCSKLTSMTIPDGVTSIENSTFGKCSNITSITVSENVKSIGYSAFTDCSKLASINIPENITSIGVYAFYNCNKLEKVEISNIAAWCKISFSDCYSNPLYYAKNLYLKGTLVTDLRIPDSIAFIGKNAFRNCKSIKNVIISDNVIKICNYAFYGCSKLSGLVLGKSITDIGDKAFSGCSGLSKVAILNNQYDAIDLISSLKTGIKIYAYNMYDNKDRAEEKNMSWVELSKYNCSDNNHCFSFFDGNVIKSATCTATGVKTIKCLLCSKESKEKISKTTHKVVTLKSRTATVKQSGLTAGSKCSVCGEILKAQTMTLAQATGLKASTVKTTSISLKWTAINGAKYYKVEQYNSSTKKWVAIKTTTSTSYTVSKLTAGTTYKFRVTALDSTKKIAGKASATLTAYTLCATPTVKLTSTKSKTATVTITKVTGAKSYTIYKSTNGTKWTKVTTTTKTSYNLTGLISGKKIYVKVVATNADGKASAYSAVKSVTVKK